MHAFLLLLLSFIYVILPAIKVKHLKLMKWLDQRSICFHEIDTFPANECDPSQKMGGGEVELLHLRFSPPNISLTHSKKGAMCFVDIYLFNPEVKGHLFMSPFQAHKKWDNWVKQGCRILLLCDGLQVIPTELFKGGGGGWGEIKKLKLKKMDLKHWYTCIHITWL